MNALTDWADQLDGHYVDRDGYPPEQPYQCHDVWLAYLTDILGGQLGDGHAPGVEGFTYEVWRAFPHHRPELRHLLTKHPGSRGIMPGDVVFWPPGSNNHPWSHVVVALSAEDSWGTIECLSQNPGPAQITRLSTHQVAGYLRPRTDPTEEPVTQEEIQKIATATARATVERLLDTKLPLTGNYKGRKQSVGALLAQTPHQFGLIKARLSTLLKRPGNPR
ncbi:MAG: CHAP domain-containing protein [Microthrixaceae bacterium]